ncbi:MAG: hypothetical protein ACNA77_03695, partial [Opitutales bacterium]
QKQLEHIAASCKSLMRFSLRCSSFPMMVKAVRTLGNAAVLPKIAEEELPPSDYQQIELKELDVLRRKLVVCWNTRLAKIETSRLEKGSSIAKLLRDAEKG